jgi:four helix bundle protein
MESTGLERLQVWQKAHGFAVLVCKEILPLLPSEENYALNQQLRRSVQSIAANIGEAHGRYHFQDAIRFCYIARGSLEETLNHLLFAHDMGYIPEDKIIACRETWRDTARLLNGYIKHLNDNLRREKGTKFRDDDQDFYEAVDEMPDY